MNFLIKFPVIFLLQFKFEIKFKKVIHRIAQLDVLKHFFSIAQKSPDDQQSSKSVQTVVSIRYDFLFRCILIEPMLPNFFRSLHLSSDVLKLSQCREGNQIEPRDISYPLARFRFNCIEIECCTALDKILKFLMAYGISLKINLQGHQQDKHVLVILVQSSRFVFKYLISQIFYYKIYSFLIYWTLFRSVTKFNDVNYFCTYFLFILQ